MLTRWSVFVPLAFVVLWVGLTGTLAAWRWPRSSQAQQQPAVSTVTLEGTVKSIGTDGFTIDASKGPSGKKTPTKEWLVAPAKATTWLVLGTADVNYLKPRQTVVFTAALDDKGQPQDKVSTLTVAPAKGNKPRITADDGEDPSRPKDHGVASVKPAAAQAKDDAARLPPLSGKSKVVGKILSCGKTKLVVAAGKEVHVELAENAVIHIALSDPKLIVVEAKVTIHGQAAETKKVRWCEPDKITVTLVQRLTGKEKPSQLAPPEKAATPKESTTPKDSGMFGF